jgi:hypothetical protein
LCRKILSPSASAAADRGLNCGRERRASRRDRESDGPQADDSFLTNVVQKLGADFQPALRDRLGETFLDSLYQLVQLLTLFTATLLTSEIGLCFGQPLSDLPYTSLIARVS